MPDQKNGRSLNDVLSEFIHDTSYLLHKMWTWPMFYVIVSCLSIVFSFLYIMSSRVDSIPHLERRIEVIDNQNSKALDKISTLKQELMDTRSTVKRLEAKIKLNPEE